MFGLVYLSTDRKRILRKLQEKLTECGDARERNEINLQIQEIYGEAEPYLNCDKFKLNELKNQILDQMRILNSLGKTTEAFDVNLRDVEYRLQTVIMEEAAAEKGRVKNIDPPNMNGERSVSMTSLKQDKKKKQAMGRTRWVIGMDDEG